MSGGTVGEVVESQHPSYQAGDKVVGMGGWQEYGVVDGGQPGVLRKVDTTHVPLSAYLGAVGMPGVTAWYGLVKIIEPKAGQTIVVSAASGAVGSAVGAAREGARLPRGRHRRRRRQVPLRRSTSSASTPASTTRRTRDAEVAVRRR